MSIIVLNARDLDKGFVFFSPLRILKRLTCTITINIVSALIKYSQSCGFFFWFWWVFLQGELFVFKAEGKLALPTQIRKGPTDDFELNLNG